MTSRRELLLRRLFERRVRPLADGPDAAFPRLDAGAASYWEARHREPPRPEDFELPLRDAREIAATLERHWTGTRLAGLGRALVRLSRRFRDVRARERVSDSVYEMF